jgi:acyl-CoA dehydrogenase
MILVVLFRLILHKTRAGTVDFQMDEDERQLREAIRLICKEFPDSYWAACDQNHEYANKFREVFVDAGFAGMCIPEEYGGGGAGIAQAVAVMEEVAASGGALNACSVVHIGLFGLLPLIRHGNSEIRSRFLPRAAKGDLQIAFAVTEPDAGTDTSRITTSARRVDGGYLVNGRKTFISGVQQAERLLLITRTTPRNEVSPTTDGMTLLFAEVDLSHIDVQEIPKLGRNVVATNALFIDDLFVPEADRIGDEGKGFRYLLDGLNPERILVASECLGIGRAALDRAVDYTTHRKVFDRPIAMNQGVQFPLAESLAKLDAVEMIIRKAAWLYDQGLPCGREANEAKLLASTFAFEAADRAMQFHGGYGYALEYHVERYWRESRLLRITPVANELILAYLSEHVLGMPRSF